MTLLEAKKLVAKKQLYKVLIEADRGGSISNLSDAEIELMYLLSKDYQIQKLFTDATKREKKNKN